MTPSRSVPARRSRRLALAAGAVLAVAVPSAVAAGTDDTKAPADTTATTATTEDAGATTAAEGSAPTDGSTPAGAAVEPLAVIDIGATGPGVDVGSVIEGPVAVANLAMTDMPVADGATVAEYSANYDVDLTDPEAPTHYGNLTIISTAQSEMPAADILAAYQAAIEPLGEYEATTATASSEGITSDRLELDPIIDYSAVETTTAGSTPGEASAAPARYEIIVSRSEEEPGLVAIELNKSIPTTDGPAPELPEAIAGDYSVPLGLAEANGWTVAGWSYRDGFNSFFGGAPLKSVDMSFAAGPGTVDDLPTVGDLLLAEFGTPTYESVETDTFSYTFEDEANWYGSIRDTWVGNELYVNWSLSLS